VYKGPWVRWANVPKSQREAQAVAAIIRIWLTPGYGGVRRLFLGVTEGQPSQAPASPCPDCSFLQSAKNAHRKGWETG
jgi:hypothetical protein